MVTSVTEMEGGKIHYLLLLFLQQNKMFDTVLEVSPL